MPTGNEHGRAAATACNYQSDWQLNLLNALSVRSLLSWPHWYGTARQTLQTPGWQVQLGSIKGKLGILQHGMWHATKIGNVIFVWVWILISDFRFAAACGMQYEKMNRTCCDRCGMGMRIRMGKSRKWRHTYCIHRHTWKTSMRIVTTFALHVCIYTAQATSMNENCQFEEGKPVNATQILSMHVTSFTTLQHVPIAGCGS